MERLTRVWFDQSSYAKWIEASGSRVVSVGELMMLRQIWAALALS
jgi:hypothetical protein